MSWRARVAAVVVSSLDRLSHQGRHSGMAAVGEAIARDQRRQMMQWSLPKADLNFTRDVALLGAVGLAYGYSIGVPYTPEMHLEPRWRISAEERAYYASL
ncbi:Hypothetical Protein FCC1311_074832 [Hondaea fermentalgiana]|uniref:Uncharacterized protein n=1 Tax=Hondaea fermentalgiana TaxID=2315210 RepID=A0A2R5GK33_9STRA|nr:Hypothetical Protein FCC1311_074832 [Hondaea fermentalgiana]|eukprot:GBG31262.1 Hypothetical Protein FCC1311_074832 [Hondaea fermentalgiana]